MVSKTLLLSFGQEQTGLILLLAFFLIGLCIYFLDNVKKLIFWTALVTSISLLMIFSIF